MIPGRACAEGFTFVEALVGVILIALVTAAAAPIARSVIETGARLARDQSRLHRIAEAYDLFRSSCERTMAPPWLPSRSTVETSNGGIRVLFLDGGEEASWSLSTREGGLVLVTSEGERVVDAHDARVDLIEQGRRVVGIGASFECLGRNWEWKGYFGAAGY